MTGSHKKNMIITKSIISVIVWFFGIIMVFPFLWMLSTSFKGMNSVFTFPIEWIPRNPTLKGYKALFDGTVPYVTYFLNSVKVALIAAAGTFFSCTMAGFGYAKVRFKGRDGLFVLKLATTMLPGTVLILPTYMIYSRFGLINTHAALWLGNFLGGTFGVFLMRQAFISLPESMIESAKIDGAGNFNIYWNIAMPNVKSSIATLLFMYFLWTWNDYEKPLLYLWDKAKYTLPMAVKAFSDTQYQNYPAIMASNVLMLLPVMIAFVTCQNFFVESLIGSSVKG
ncbi:MAG: carbohydrate ABC transporter permease [Lachnospiraceae bacterium]|nr:carbohydrate ABC transporter permease [Lachnospiraceae bacterium]